MQGSIAWCEALCQLRLCQGVLANLVHLREFVSLFRACPEDASAMQQKAHVDSARRRHLDRACDVPLPKPTWLATDKPWQATCGQPPCPTPTTDCNTDGGQVRHVNPEIHSTDRRYNTICNTSHIRDWRSGKHPAISPNMHRRNQRRGQEPPSPIQQKRNTLTSRIGHGKVSCSLSADLGETENSTQQELLCGNMARQSPKRGSGGRTMLVHASRTSLWPTSKFVLCDPAALGARQVLARPRRNALQAERKRQATKRGGARL